MLSCVQLFMTPWTIAHQGPLSMGFPRQEYWSRLPFPTPGDLPDPGIKPVSLVLPTLAGGFFTTEPPGKCPLTLRVDFSQCLCSTLSFRSSLCTCASVHSLPQPCCWMLAHLVVGSRGVLCCLGSASALGRPYCPGSGG